MKTSKFQQFLGEIFSVETVLIPPICILQRGGMNNVFGQNKFYIYMSRGIDTF